MINNKHKKMASMIQTTPDISYQLIFCFLDLKELPSIARCSKNWNRLITDTSFLNMFRHNKTFKLLPTNGRTLYTGSFTQIIREIRISNLNHTLYLVNFNRLKSLDMTFWWGGYAFEIDRVFQILSPRLLELKLSMNNWCSFVGSDRPACIVHFQKVLSHLNLLTFLSIMSNRRQIFTDISFLSQMKQLQSFCFDDFYNGPTNDIYHCLSSLPHLTCLNSCTFTHSKTISDLKEICAQAEKFAKLKQIGSFCDYEINDENNQYQYLQLLNQIPSLESIEINFHICPIKIPSLLGKWIRELHFGVGNINEEQVSILIHLPQLKSLNLNSPLTIDASNLQKMIRGLSSRLEVLVLSTYYLFEEVYEVSVQDILTCTRLKTLSLQRIIIRGDIDLLRNCDQLKTFKIYHCTLYDTHGLESYIDSIYKTTTLPVFF
jgi:hypothetical protein